MRDINRHGSTKYAAECESQKIHLNQLHQWHLHQALTLSSSPTTLMQDQARSCPCSSEQTLKFKYKSIKEQMPNWRKPSVFQHCFGDVYTSEAPMGFLFISDLARAPCWKAVLQNICGAALLGMRNHSSLWPHPQANRPRPPWNARQGQPSAVLLGASWAQAGIPHQTNSHEDLILSDVTFSPHISLSTTHSNLQPPP